MYDCTSTSQKTKNAKTALDSMSKAVLQSLRQRRSAATSLYTKEALIGLFYFIWRGSAYFIDSLKPLLLTGAKKYLTGQQSFVFIIRLCCFVTARRAIAVAFRREELLNREVDALKRSAGVLR